VLPREIITMTIDYTAMHFFITTYHLSCTEVNMLLVHKNKRSTLKYFYIKELAKTYHTNRDVVVCGSGGSCVEDLETWNQWSVVQLA